MGRPTTDPKTRVIKLRINEDIADGLDKLGGNLSENVRGFIEDGLKNLENKCCVLQKTEENVVLVDTANHIDVIDAFKGMTDYEVGDFRNMCKLSGITVDELIEKVYRSWIEGRFGIENGEIVVEKDRYHEKVVGLCLERGLDYGKMMELCIRSIEGYKKR